jgi:lysophospholipase L1-like esterase
MNQRKAVLLLFALALLVGCSTRISLRSGDRIVFFGDSITELGVKPNGYVTLIKAELSNRHPDLGIEVIGAGISANKVTDLLNRLGRDVLDEKPNVVVIYIGINDVWHWALKNLQGTRKDQYESGLREIIARIQYADAMVVLCTPSVIGEKYDGTNPQDAMLEEYAAISRKVAEDLGIRLCDLRKAFLKYLAANNKENKEKDILTDDRVHLNDTGNRFVAQEILKSFGEQ